MEGQQIQQNVVPQAPVNQAVAPMAQPVAVPVAQAPAPAPAKSNFGTGAKVALFVGGVAVGAVGTYCLVKKPWRKGE